MSGRSSSTLGDGGGLGRILAVVGVAVAVCASAQPAFGSPGLTELMSVTPGGTTGNAGSGFLGVAISDDGRFVAFESRASDLVPGDTDDSRDVFVQDRLTGSTERVSVDLAGGNPNDDTSGFPVISADGRFVAFNSSASDLVQGDRDQTREVFLRDRLTGVTSQISVDSAGREHKGESFVNRNVESISAEGRFVAFSSYARLAPEDQNEFIDVYVRDRLAGRTTIVSREVGGADGNADSFGAPISADGRYVAFGSDASNLVAGDTNGVHDVFVHDRATGATTRVSVDSAGIQGNEFSFPLSTSADGRYVAIVSLASNLVAGDTNGVRDVFVHDRVAGTTTRVSVSSDGSQADRAGFSGSLSADGRYVAFASGANLVPGDTNRTTDIFLHDRVTGVTTRESVDSAGGQSNGLSFLPVISGDGTTVAHTSLATNLTANEDLNGEGKGNGADPGWDVFSHELQPSGP